MMDVGPPKLSSPKLSTSSECGAGAYETKFLLSNDLAEEVLESVRLRLPADPHADPECGDGYQVNSLYFDTPGRDTYHREEGYRRRKFRLRRYGRDSQVFLERKSKSKGLVKKRRTVVAEDEVGMLQGPQPCSEWPGLWYREQLEKRSLTPVCNVTYERVARVGMTPEGPIRFTVDRQIRCCAASGLLPTTVDQGTQLLKGQCILELKYRVAMPAVFKQLMYEFTLVPTRVSKFRMSIEVCRLAQPMGIGRSSTASKPCSHAVPACAR